MNMACPKCKYPMVVIPIPGENGHVCTKCGYWRTVDFQWNIISEKDKIGGRDGNTMDVTYNGFTGELFKLERSPDFERGGISYNLEIRDHEKKVTYVFDRVKLSDVKFLGGSVFFGGGNSKPAT